MTPAPTATRAAAAWPSAAAVGAAGLGLTAARRRVSTPAARCPPTWWPSSTGSGIALGALILLGAFHASNARWPVVLRRFAGDVPAVAPALRAALRPHRCSGCDHLFPWIAPGRRSSGELRHLVEHKRPYLNVPFFVRPGGRLLRLLDGGGGAAAPLVAAAGRRRRVAAHRAGSGGWAPGALPLLALTLSFAAFDWMMSLDPRFFSTIFGVYWFAGSFLAAFAVLIIAAAPPAPTRTQFGAPPDRRALPLAGEVPARLHRLLGLHRLLPVHAHLDRQRAGGGALVHPPHRRAAGAGWASSWRPVHFLVPFFLLLSRDLKRNPRPLAWVAAWVLLVALGGPVLAGDAAPRRRPGRASPLGSSPPSSGVGGLAVAFAAASACAASAPSRSGTRTSTTR